VQKKILEMGAFPHRGQLGNLWCPLTEYLKRQLERSRKGASPSVGALLGDPLSGDSEGYGKGD